MSDNAKNAAPVERVIGRFAVTINSKLTVSKEEACQDLRDRIERAYPGLDDLVSVEWAGD